MSRLSSVSTPKTVSELQKTLRDLPPSTKVETYDIWDLNVKRDVKKVLDRYVPNPKRPLSVIFIK